MPVTRAFGKTLLELHKRLDILYYAELLKLQIDQNIFVFDRTNNRCYAGKVISKDEHTYEVRFMKGPQVTKMTFMNNGVNFNQTGFFLSFVAVHLNESTGNYIELNL